MKKIWLTICMALLSFCGVKAQKIHFTDSANHWITTGYDCSMYPIYGVYLYTGDTLIAGNKYRYLQETLWDYGCMYGICDTVLGYWVREDTTVGKVFLWVDDTDKVLYDYALLPGDTLNYSYLPSPFWYVDTVSARDSFLIYPFEYKMWAVFKVDTLSHGYASDTQFCWGGVPIIWRKALVPYMARSHPLILCMH